jgi:hypothetical protein
MPNSFNIKHVKLLELLNSFKKQRGKLLALPNSFRKRQIVLKNGK